MIRAIFFCFAFFYLLVSDAQAQIKISANDQSFDSLAVSIGVDDNYEKGDWSPVLKAVGNKRLVFLGEMNHGTKEIFITRNELIKKLHQEKGFDVILFESGMGEVGAIQQERDSLSNIQMTGGFFWGWRTQEFAELMGYVKDNGLAIAGFDVQKTGTNFHWWLEKEARSQGLNKSLYQGIEHRFEKQKRRLNSREAVYDSLKKFTMDLVRDYQSLSNQIVSLQIKRVIENRISYLQYYLSFTKTGDWNQRWRDRDQLMAENVEWLLENQYQNRKVIVVAHNFHISKYNEKEEVMGEFLADKYNANRYVLGVFAGEGSYADNSGKEIMLQPEEKNGLDIKKIINSLSGQVNFIDISNTKTNDYKFLLDDVITNDTFIDLSNSNTLVPAEHFDGLLLIDRISPPKRYRD